MKRVCIFGTPEDLAPWVGSNGVGGPATYFKGYLTAGGQQRGDIRTQPLEELATLLGEKDLSSVYACVVHITKPAYAELVLGDVKSLLGRQDLPDSFVVYLVVGTGVKVPVNITGGRHVAVRDSDFFTQKEQLALFGKIFLD